jgi:hypothetical protein
MKKLLPITMITLAIMACNTSNNVSTPTNTPAIIATPLATTTNNVQPSLTPLATVATNEATIISGGELLRNNSFSMFVFNYNEFTEVPLTPAPTNITPAEWEVWYQGAPYVQPSRMQMFEHPVFSYDLNQQAAYWFNHANEIFAGFQQLVFLPETTEPIDCLLTATAQARYEANLSLAISMGRYLQTDNEVYTAQVFGLTDEYATYEYKFTLPANTTYFYVVIGGESFEANDFYLTRASLRCANIWFTDERG